MCLLWQRTTNVTLLMPLVQRRLASELGSWVEPRWQRWSALALIVWLSIGVCCSAGAQVPARFLPQALEQLGAEVTQIKASDTAPDLSMLQVGWWHYYLDKATLQTRVDELISQLSSRAEQVTDPTNSKLFQQQVELIKASALGYAAAMLTEPETPPRLNERTYQTAYTPSEIIRLADEIRTLEQQRSQTDAEINTAQKSLANVNTRLDNRFAKYLQTTEQSNDHLLSAYQVIADRFALMLTAARIDRRQHDLQALTKTIEAREEELKFAQNHLATSIKAISENGQQIVKLEQELEAAKAATIEARVAASAINSAGLVEQARAKWLNQRLVNAELKEALIEMTLQRWHAERILLGLLNKGIDPGQARAQLAVSEATRNTLSNRVSQLKADTAEEADLVYRTDISESSDVGSVAELAYDLADNRALQAITMDRIQAVQEAQRMIGQFTPVQNNFTLLFDLAQSKIFELEGTFKNVGGKTQLFFNKVGQWFSDSFNKSLFRLGDTPVTPKGILIALAVMLSGWLLSWMLRRFLYSLADEGDYSHSVYYTVGRLAHYALILLSFLLGISLLGISLTSFAVVAGALAIGIGFGLQAIVNNFISGLILLFERTLKVGDFIEFTNTGLRGEVKAINVRSTQIKTNDNVDIIVPNSEFMNTKVVNWTLHEPYRRMVYDFKVGFDIDKKVVREAVTKAASALPYTLTGIPGKGPQVWLVGYGEFAYHMQLAVWLKPSAVKRPQVVNAAYYWAIDNALEDADIQIPVPQREVRIVNPEMVYANTPTPPGSGPGG